MKRCPACGHKLRKEDKFCPSCGKKLITPTKKKQIQKVKPEKEEKKEPKEEKKEPKKVIKEPKKVIYGYLAVISFFVFTIVNIILSERVTDMSTILEDILFVGGTVSYFAWFGLGLYLLADKETRIHGLILFVLWLLFGMKSLAYQTTPWYERIFK